MTQQIPLNELKHSPNNVRKVKGTEAGLMRLAKSIETQGLLHNLVVAPNGSGYVVIDGNRRLEALQHLLGESSSNLINCVVMDSDNPEVGLHANMMREDMHPLDECDVIQSLVADGEEDYDSVAKRFGRTQKWVQQRVALAELSDKAKEAFRVGEFNLAVASALTLGTHEQQDAYLKEYEDRQHYADTAKRFMVGGKIPLTACLFEIDDKAYHASALEIEGDLFGDEKYITNLAVFHDYQMNWCEHRIEELQKDYMDAIMLVDQYYFDSPECKSMKHATDDDADSDCIMVCSYNTNNYRWTEHRMITWERDQANKELEEAQQEEEVALTPWDYTAPQRTLLDAYYADFVKNKLYENDNGFLSALMKAIICHRRLGYSYSNVNRVGHVYADYQRIFKEDEQPYGYSKPDYEKYIDTHTELAQKAWDDNEIPPLHYCLNLDSNQLDKLFVAVCLTGLSNVDMADWTIKETHPDFTAEEKWFKPDMKWLNKYKTEQLDLLATQLMGNPKGQTKKDKVENIYKFLQESPNFDPFNKPQ